jgi:hypothetical protein
MHGEVEKLARWVILQCLADAGLRSPNGHTAWDVTSAVKSEAISFLTSSTGEWRRSREFWCHLADRDPDALREWTTKKLAPLPQAKDIPTPPSANPPRRGPKSGTKLAALVESLRSPTGITLDEMMVRFGWSRVTCSTAISGDLPAKFGFRSRRGPDGRYRLIEAA